MRRVTCVFLALAYLSFAASSAMAQSWIGSGTPVTLAANAQVGVTTCGDGADGVFLAWVDFRGAAADIYLQHLDADGAVVAGWPADGAAVCTAMQQQLGPVLTPDGTGGVYIAWTDYRTGSADIYLTRVRSDGTRAPGWSADGDAVSNQVAIRQNPRLALDAEGGVYVAFERVTVSLDVYLSRIDGSGVRVPGWPIAGLALTSSVADEDNPVIATDASGACLAVWVNEVLNDGDLHGARVRPNATLATGWAMADGLPLLPTIGPQYDVQLVPRSDGGWLVYFLDDAQDPGNTDVRATAVDSTGTVLPGWGGAAGVGILTRDSTDTIDFVVRGDGADGAVAVSREYALTTDDASLYAIHHDAGHNSLWPNAVSLTRAGVTSAPALVRDSQGAFLVAFADSFTASHDVHAIRFSAADGTTLSGWAPNTGNAVCEQPGDQSSPVIVASASGSGIVAWIDGRGPNLDLYAARVGSDGVVPTQVSFVDFSVRPDAVELMWFADGAGLETATLERRQDEGAWSPLTTLFRDGDGRFQYVDRAVRPGTSYGYRLRTRDDASAEIRVLVPMPASLALSLRNPAQGALEGRVTLPSDSEAELVVLDVTGRTRHRLILRGAGAQSFRLPDSALEPGVYLAELTQSGRTTKSKFSVVR